MDEIGVYWVEVMDSGSRGPEVILLFPIVCGGTPSEVLSGEIPLSWSLASGPDQVLEELNLLRVEEGLGELTRSEFLDSVASERAAELAISGRYDHFCPDSTSLAELLPHGAMVYGENIGRGRSFQEAWSMILISPLHLRTCLSPDFSEVGIAGAIDSGRFQWQIVMVQIFLRNEGDR